MISQSISDKTGGDRDNSLVLAVIVHYFDGAAMIACIRSLQRGTRSPDRILVIDNGSEPGWKEGFQREFPLIDIQQNSKNLSFAASLPGTIAECSSGPGGEYGSVLILNQDCELDPGCLEKLCVSLEHHEVAICCPTVLDKQGRIWAQGGSINLITGRNRNLRQGEPVDYRSSKEFDVDYAPACVLLARTEVWKKARGMEPRFFMYGEDADLSLRVRKMGYRVRCVSEAIAVHEGSAAAGSEYAPFQSYFRFRNRALFLTRHARCSARVLFWALILPLLLLRDGWRYALRLRLDAFREALRGLFTLNQEPDPPNPPRVSERILLDQGRSYVYRSKFRRACVRGVDAVGDVLCGSAQARMRRPLPDTVRRILIVQMGHLGDTVVAIPAIEALAAAYPWARIDALVSPAAAPLLDGSPVHQVETVDSTWLDRGPIRLKEIIRVIRLLRPRRFDLALELRGDPLSILITHLTSRFTVGLGHGGLGFLLNREHPGWREGHQARMLLEVALLSGAPQPLEIRPNLRLGREDDTQSEVLLQEYEDAPIVFHVGARDPRKIWAPESYAAVAATLHEEGFPIVVLGVQEEEELFRRFQNALRHPAKVLGQLALQQTVALLRRSTAFVGNDAGPAHMAAAVGTPAVVVFAPVNESTRWRPIGNNVEIVLPMPGQSFQELAPVEVVNAVRRVLAGQKKFLDERLPT